MEFCKTMIFDNAAPSVARRSTLPFFPAMSWWPSPFDPRSESLP
jgi:hypothetical protein